MKKMKRFASAALAALMLAGSVPSALALDATPPLYQQFGYDNADDYMEQEAWFTMLDYDAASDLYRQYMDTIHKKPQVALDYYGYETLAALDEEIEWGAWESREDFYRYAAIQMVSDDDWELHRQLTVQLNGDMIKFPDARPEKVNGRVMVPFRAIAEALGKEVWPADRDTLVSRAQESNAPDAVLSALHRLPGDRQFTNVQEVAEALGLGTEQQRF